MDIFNDAVGAITKQISGLWPQPTEKPQLVNGKLRPCPGTPNCVSSENNNPLFHVAPITFNTTPESAWVTLKQIIIEQGGTIQDEGKEYIWSTFTVSLFGFIDDVEFRLSATEKMIHVRSSSRLGISDLGVNRGRVEQLRTLFHKASDNH
ncbi:MAG: DUF1499 domain-containing protein [Chlorobium sp.]